MKNKFKKLTLSVAASAVLVGNAFALDPAVTNFGYVGGDGIPLSIFNAADPTKIKSISGFSNSLATEIDPTGKYFYVSGWNSNSHQLTKLNALTGAVINDLAIGNNPWGIVLSSNGSKAYLANSYWADSVHVIDTATNTITAMVAVGSDPTGIVLSPDGLKAFVTNRLGNSVSVIDTTTNTVTATITVGQGPLGIIISSDGSKVYATNGADGSISVINTATNTVTATVTVGNRPLGITLSPDGSKAFVANRDSNSLSVIDTVTNAVLQTITGLDQAQGISISPDGTMLYVRGSSNDKLFTIRTNDYTVTTYTGFSSSTSGSTVTYLANISPFISPNLITGTLDTSSAADMTTKGFTNYVNFAGGTLRATGSFTLSNPIYLHDAFNLTYDDSSTFTTVAGGTVDTNGNDVEFSGEVSGVGGLTKTGTGVLTLSGTNTYSGGTTINGGLINFATADNFGSGNITLNGGGLQWASGNVTDISARLEAIGAGGATFDTNSNDVTLASVLSGTGSVTKSGDGILTLGGTNTYSGGTTVSAGTLNGNTTNLQGNILNNSIVEFAQASDGTFGDVISGTGALNKSDVGVLTLSGANTYSGGTTLNGGTLSLSGGSAIADAGAVIVNTGATLHVASAETVGSVNGVGSITLDDILTTGGANTDDTIGGVIGGTGALSKSGAGVLTISGTNTYSGGTTITGGLINFATADNFGSGNITLNGGGLQWATGNTTDISARLEAIGVNGATFDTNANDVALASVLSGTGGVTKSGTGVLTLSGTNTYSGDTTVAAGTLSLSGGDAIADTGAVVVNSGAILHVASAETVGSINGAGNITLDANLETGGVNTDDTISGIISGTGALNKSGAGTLTLSGTNTYSGATTINGGLINFADGANLGTANVTLNGGGLQWATGNTTDISARLEAIGVNGATFDTNANDVTLASVLSGTGGVTKSGTGVLTLSGTNTYSGATTINAGTLDITGDTSSSAFSIANGATLLGDGTVGSTTVASGGILAPTAVSTLNVAGNLIMDAGSTLKINTYANGTNSKVSATGTATINGGSVNVVADGSGTWNNSTVYTVLSATNGITGTFTGVTDNLAFLDPSLSYESGAVKLTLARNDVSYVDVVVPPPPPAPPPPVVEPEPEPEPIPEPVVTPEPEPEPIPEPTPEPEPIPEPTPEPEPIPEPTRAPYASLSTLQVAQALDNGSASPNQDMQQLYTILNSMSAEQARETILQLNGTPLGSLAQQNSTQIRNFSTSLFSRMSSGGSGGGVGLASLAFADNGEWTSVFKHLLDEGAVGENGFIEPQKLRDSELWIRAMGGKTYTDGDKSRNINKSTVTSSGVQAGIDKHVTDWIFGASFGYLKNSMEQTGLDGKIDSYQLGLYVSNETKNYRLSFSGIGGKYDNDTTRTMLTGTTNAKYEGTSLSAEVKAAYKYHFSKTLRVEPTIGGWVQSYAQDGFTESGTAGSTLSVDKATFNSQAITTELKVVNIFDNDKNSKKTFEASIGYAHEYGDVNAPLVGRFSASPDAGSFSIASANRGRDVLTTTLGGDISLTKNSRLFTLVNANFRENEKSYSAMGGIKIGF